MHGDAELLGAPLHRRSRELEPAESATALKKSVAAAIRRVARRLGNTPAVCRRCYVHPAIFQAHAEGRLAAQLAPTPSEAQPPSHALTTEEQAVLLLLRGEAALACAA